MKFPVVAAFATGDPDSIPIKALAKIAVLAGPPRKRPVNENDISINHFPPPSFSRNDPNKTKMMINVAEIPIGTPKIPSDPKYKKKLTVFLLTDLCDRTALENMVLIAHTLEMLE